MSVLLGRACRLHFVFHTDIGVMAFRLHFMFRCDVSVARWGVDINVGVTR